jgi:hypothetical protein
MNLEFQFPTKYTEFYYLCLKFVYEYEKKNPQIIETMSDNQ